MKEEKIKQNITGLETILHQFTEAKKKGKETNSNEERVESIKEIEQSIQQFELYLRNNDGLLELIAGTKKFPGKEIKWDDVVRPEHFEEDLREEIKNLKQKVD